MSLPASAAREPLQRYIRQQTLTDRQMRVLLRDAASASRRILAQAKTPSAVRAAQLDVARQQQLLWGKLGGTIETGVRSSGDAASKSVARLISMFEGSVGVELLPYRALEASLIQQGRAGIEAVLARGVNGVPLSDRVYKNSSLYQGKVDRAINAMLVNGASAKEIARDVARFISPDVPGGVSYAAMRLGRTELNNAFHQVTKDHWDGNPFVTGLKWNLSRSHPKPDECDQYAEKSWKPRDVPVKPHPQCLCFTTPEVEDDDTFVNNFHAGHYDKWIDEQMRHG